MSGIGLCVDIAEAVDLFEPQGLFLKPIARINISVQLPQLKAPGKSISNWEVMEKLKKMVKPDQFIVLKVVKSTLEFVRFEGEIENKSKLKVLTQRLDGKCIKLGGFPETLKVRAAEAKIAFPQRHDWDSFFRDATNMNEMKPGERPDTIHFRELPSRWFANRKDKEKDKPNEYMLKKVFETFGDIRCVDIPMLDPYRKDTGQVAGNIQTFSFGQDLTFEAFVQYTEYIGFVKAMTALKGMKLLFKSDDGKAYVANMKVEFDRTKHLSDRAIKKRRVEREKLKLLEKAREERVRQEREEEERRKAEDARKQEEEIQGKLKRKEEKVKKQQERRRNREENRKERRLERKRRIEEKQMAMRIALEERKILIAQRKLETIRLLSEVFNRIKVIKQQEELERNERELEEARLLEVEREKQDRIQKEQKKIEHERKKKERLVRQERDLRDKILKNYKAMEERKAEMQREDLRKKIAGSTRLKSAVIMKKKLDEVDMDDTSDIDDMDVT